MLSTTLVTVLPAITAIITMFVMMAAYVPVVNRPRLLRRFALVGFLVYTWITIGMAAVYYVSGSARLPLEASPAIFTAALFGASWMALQVHHEVHLG